MVDTGDLAFLEGFSAATDFLPEVPYVHHGLDAAFASHEDDAIPFLADDYRLDQAVGRDGISELYDLLGLELPPLAVIRDTKGVDFDYVKGHLLLRVFRQGLPVTNPHP
ncbi:hypothetical protein CCP3SC15_580014 [Gammaproteobacteria bacterium]